MSLNTEYKFKTGGIIFALVRACCTTVLYDYNITGLNIHCWEANLPMCGTFESLCRNALFAVADNYINRNALIFTCTYDLIYNLTGSSLDTGAQWRARWNRQRGINHEILPNRSPYIYWMHVTPQAPQVMCVDGWLSKRPMEWGISKPSPKLFLAPLIVLENGVVKGLYPRLGSSDYITRVNSNNPSLLVNYGNGVFNNALQGFWQNEQFPTIRYQTAQWSHGSIASFEWPDVQPVPSDHREYMGLRIFKPCTILTFDHNTERVLAPMIMGTNNNENYLITSY